MTETGLSPVGAKPIERPRNLFPWEITAAKRACRRNARGEEEYEELLEMLGLER